MVPPLLLAAYADASPVRGNSVHATANRWGCWCVPAVATQATCETTLSGETFRLAVPVLTEAESRACCEPPGLRFGAGTPFGRLLSPAAGSLTEPRAMRPRGLLFAAVTSAGCCAVAVDGLLVGVRSSASTTAARRGRGSPGRVCAVLRGGRRAEAAEGVGPLLDRFVGIERSRVQVLDAGPCSVPGGLAVVRLGVRAGRLTLVWVAGVTDSGRRCVFVEVFGVHYCSSVLLSSLLCRSARVLALACSGVGVPC